MPLPIAGEIEVVVGSATPVNIHGDGYADLALFPPGDSKPTMTRIPIRTFPADAEGRVSLPSPGDRIVVRVLLGQVDSLRMATED
ncbi:MAG: hypothetical protein GY895_12635 [Phycisphaera sp.]|nr:hypothetical protein [Phycisphaera sp.]